MGDDATILNVTLRRLAVSLSSPSSLLSVAVSVSSTVEDTSMTTLSGLSWKNTDESSGDGSTTQYPIQVDPTNPITSTTWMTIDELVTQVYFTDDQNDSQSPDNPDVQPKMDAVVSKSSSLLKLGEGFPLHLSLWLTTCTIIISRLTLHNDG